MAKPKLTALITAGTLSFVTALSASTGAPTEQTRIEAFTRSYLSHVNAEAYQTEANVEALNYDALEIIEFAKTQVAYEAYDGTLRGPAGTLISRAGNALDQSLLLAKLLRDAGYDARIVGASLSGEQVDALINEMLKPKPEAVPQADIDGLLATIEQYSKSGLDKVAGRQLLQSVFGPLSAKQYPDELDTVRRTSSELLTLLASGDVELNTLDLQEALRSEAAAYYWVQTREAASDGWRDVHPAFSGEVPANMPAPQQTFADSVPEELQHRFRFQVFIEQKSGDTLKAFPLGSAWERPTANLVGVPMAFYNMPTGAAAEGADAMHLSVLMTPDVVLAPMFGTTVIDGGWMFDLAGNRVDQMVASDAASGVFKQTGRGFSDAIGEIGGKENLPLLTAQWIEYSLIAPGGATQTYRRFVYDRVGPGHRAAGTFPEGISEFDQNHAMDLLQRHSFMLHLGQMPVGYAINQSGQYFLDTLPMVEEEARRQAGQSVANRSNPAVTPQWPGHAQLQSLFDVAATLEPGRRVYRPSPALVVHRTGLSNGVVFEEIDIVSNPVRAAQNRAGQVLLDPAVSLEAGVWETLMEGAFLDGNGARTNTWSAMADARSNGVDIRLISDISQLKALDISADSSEVIARDLERGFVVVLPEKESDPLTTGWWRIDPSSGETLGLYGDGRGVQYLKYITLTNIASVVTYGCLAYGVAGCVGGAESYGSWLCCMTVTGIGFAIGKVFFASAAVASVIWDFGSGIPNVGGACNDNFAKN